MFHSKLHQFVEFILFRIFFLFIFWKSHAFTRDVLILLFALEATDESCQLERKKQKIVMNEPYEKQLNQWLLSVAERTSLTLYLFDSTPLTHTHSFIHSLTLSVLLTNTCVECSVFRRTVFSFSHLRVVFVKLALRLQFFFFNQPVSQPVS